MFRERIEKLRQEYTGQPVTVDVDRPELARFAGIPATVKTVNFNGRALVQFEGHDRSWYDIGLDYLKVVDKPQPEPAENKPPSPAGQIVAGRPDTPPTGKEGLSRLELARLEKGAASPSEKPSNGA